MRRAARGRLYGLRDSEVKLRTLAGALPFLSRALLWQSYVALRFSLIWLSPSYRHTEYTDKIVNLRTRLLLLAAVQSRKSDVRHLNNLETNSWDITDGVTLATEASNEHLILQ